MSARSYSLWTEQLIPGRRFPRHDSSIRNDKLMVHAMDCMYEELSSAESVDKILRVTGRYLSSWSREEISALPATCRPSEVRSYEDIEFWADRLKDESERAILFLDDELKLDGLTTHFLIASVRLRQVEH
jgi:hypothetical protein